MKMTPFETRCSLSNCATIRSRHILLFPVVVVVIYTNVRENYHISYRIACYMSFDGKLEFSIYEFGTNFSKSMAWIECKLPVVRSINYRQCEEKLKYYRKRIYRWTILTNDLLRDEILFFFAYGRSKFHLSGISAILIGFWSMIEQREVEILTIILTYIIY